MKKHIVELIMACLLLICFYYLSREAAAVSVEMNQKQVIVVDCGHGGMDPGMIGIDGLKEKDGFLNSALYSFLPFVSHPAFSSV